jgi:hypothetical protein
VRDLKESAAAYADYAENTLPKLKRTYFRKCQEYEDLCVASTQPGGASQASSFLEVSLQSSSYPSSDQTYILRLTLDTSSLRMFVDAQEKQYHHSLGDRKHK